MKPISKVSVAAMAALLGPALCLAQQQSSKPASQEKQAKSAPAKPAPKVWTGDDLTSLRTPADEFAREQQAEAAAAAEAAKRQAAAQAAAKDAPSAPKDHPPLLSNPKTADSADNMIAWEDRDLTAQQEYLERLKTQLENAPPDKQAHLQQTIQDEMKTIETIQKEKQGLVQQKQQLEKKSSTGGSGTSSSSQPQSQ